MTDLRIRVARTVTGALALALTLLVPVASAQVEHGILFEDASSALEGDFFRSSAAFGGFGLSGLAWLDADGDGDLDLFVPSGPLGNGLFLNDGDGSFTESAAASGAAIPGLMHLGVAAGDLDNDGDPDLLVPGETPGPFNVLFNVLRNDGGTFSDLPETGIGAFPSTFATTLLDYDDDGLLDLWVAGPGTVGLPESFGVVDGEGNPLAWPARMDGSRLYRNLGGFAFEDVTEAAGIGKKEGSCTTAAFDYDDDGDLDVMVGNCNEITEGEVFGNCPLGAVCPVCDGADDLGPCRPEGSGGNPLAGPVNLWRNNGDGTFTDVAEDPASGLTDVFGYWMSVNPGDVDGDGDLDVFLTSLGDTNGGPHALLRNNGDGSFTDIGVEAGVANWEFAWGASLQDFDNDGDLDLFFSGHFPGIAFGPVGDVNPGRLFWNDGNGNFTENSAALGVDLSLGLTSGAAAGDYDADGFLDLAVVSETLLFDDLGAPIFPQRALLLHNGGNGNTWMRLAAYGTVGNRDGVGARFTVRSRSGTQTRELALGAGFLSTETSLVHVGLGEDRWAIVDVEWPSGYRNRVYGVRAGQTTKFPELPCSIDDPDASLIEFVVCNLEALDELVEDGVISQRRRSWLLASALRAWGEEH